MGRRGKYKKKWKRRDRSKHERRDMYRKKRGGGGKGRPLRRNEGPRHYFPGESEYEKMRRASQESPHHSYSKAGVVGVVERVSDDSLNRRLLAGYLVRRRNISDCVEIHLSQDQPFYLFLLADGIILKETDDVREGNFYFSFNNDPNPIFHRSFTPHDMLQPKKAFEPHCKNVIGYRIREMRKEEAPKERIDEYKEKSEEFLNLAGELFKAHGRY